MTYRLEDLGAHEFEHLVQALLIKLYGPTVRVFGAGADDGRDATFEGNAVSADGGAHASGWDGYHVFQVKFREQLLTSELNKQWMLSQIRSEFRNWKKGRKGTKPEYLVFVTNVPLSGQISGAIDQSKDLIRSLASEQGWALKDCAVWDRAKVERLLDGLADVRQRFNGLITPGDVLAATNLRHMTTLDTVVDDIRPLLEEHARTELITRGQINLGEAGQLANQKLDLAHVAVDLPARFRDNFGPFAEDVLVLKHLLSAGDQVLRPSVVEARQSHFLLMGGPGQGKTTLGRLLTQSYRASLFADDDRHSLPVRTASASTLARLAEMGINRPKHRRWPIRVDLAEFADLAGAGADLTLLRYIADRISAVTGGTFHARDMRAWLRAWPWLLVLDGYDEVAAKVARDNVAAAVQGLLETAHSEDADLLVVATTRPQGYSDELPVSFRKLDLLDLSPAQAVDYASRLTDLRMGRDAEKPAVLRRITAATQNELTRRLMRTPLQVMIMSLLLERRSKPPQDRAGLFGDYYDVIYDREVQKKSYLATVLADHRPDIDAIHQVLGIKLQAASEGAGEAEALLSNEEFAQVIRTRLLEQEHEGVALDRLSGELLQAARDRLVLVTAKGREQVGFELRSLQEYMAGRALVDDLDERVIDRLRLIAPSAHWRNTWLLAVGAVHRDRPQLFERVIHMMRELDADDPFSFIIETGPRLAVDILDDGMVSKSPKHLRLLVDLALDSLRGVNLGSARLGQVLVEVGNADAVRPRVVDALQRAWDGSPSAHRAAAAVLRQLSEDGQVGPLAARARQMRAAGPAAPHPVDSRAAGAGVRLADALPVTAKEWPKDSVPGRFYQELRQVQIAVDPDGEIVLPGGLRPGLAATQVVTDVGAIGEVAEAVDGIEPYNWSARTAIVSLLWRARERLPVAPALDRI